MASSLPVVAPQEFTIGWGLVELGKQVLRNCGEGGDKAREGLIRARVILGQDRLARSAEGHTKVINHEDDT